MKPIIYKPKNNGDAIFFLASLAEGIERFSIEIDDGEIVVEGYGNQMEVGNTSVALYGGVDVTLQSFKKARLFIDKKDIEGYVDSMEGGEFFYEFKKPVSVNVEGRNFVLSIYMGKDTPPGPDLLDYLYENGYF